MKLNKNWNEGPRHVFQFQSSSFSSWIYTITKYTYLYDGIFYFILFFIRSFTKIYIIFFHFNNAPFYFDQLTYIFYFIVYHHTVLRLIHKNTVLLLIHSLFYYVLWMYMRSLISLTQWDGTMLYDGTIQWQPIPPIIQNNLNKYHFLQSVNTIFHLKHWINFPSIHFFKFFF